jgi:hypothetical protein
MSRNAFRLVEAKRLVATIEVTDASTKASAMLISTVKLTDAAATLTSKRCYMRKYWRSEDDSLHFA